MAHTSRCSIFFLQLSSGDFLNDLFRHYPFSMICYVRHFGNLFGILPHCVRAVPHFTHSLTMNTMNTVDIALFDKREIANTNNAPRNISATTMQTFDRQILRIHPKTNRREYGSKSNSPPPPTTPFPKTPSRT